METTSERWKDVLLATSFTAIALIIPVLVSLKIITERKQAEAARRDSEERFEAFIENSPTAISIKDTDARYLLTNREHEKLFGVTGGQVMGKTPHDMFPAEQADLIMAHQREVLESGTAVQRELTYVLGDEARVFLVVKFPVPDVAGDPAYVGSIAMDITERKQAEESLQGLSARLRSVMSIMKPRRVTGASGSTMSSTS